jgi:hydroxyacylglutathione hydrolase
MYLDVFDENPYGTNCWLLAGEGSDDAVVVDVGFSPDRVHAMLEAAGKRPVAVILTHAHVDHAEAAGLFAGEDLPVYIHEADALAFADPDGWNPGAGKRLQPVADNDVLSFAGFDVQVLHTPGHTPGHCVFTTDALVFSGDLVFAGSIGRSDFSNSSPADMQVSLERFLTLDDGLPVLPGHGQRTSVGGERATNPFLVGMA